MRTWNPHWMVKVLLFTAGAIFVALCAVFALATIILPLVPAMLGNP